MKGISPLIAVVLLIFITMVIAGIMATWATSLFRAETQELDCIGALVVDYPSFDGENVSVKVRNTDDSTVLSGFTVYLSWADGSIENYTATQGGLADPLNPATIDMFAVNTEITTEPQTLEIIASSCPKGAVSVSF